MYVHTATYPHYAVRCIRKASCAAGAHAQRSAFVGLCLGNYLILFRERRYCLAGGHAQLSCSGVQVLILRQKMKDEVPSMHPKQVTVPLTCSSLAYGYAIRCECHGLTLQEDSAGRHTAHRSRRSRAHPATIRKLPDHLRAAARRTMMYAPLLSIRRLLMTSHRRRLIAYLLRRT